jgi:ABC-2 type transport system ATP-binding protein
MEYVIEAENLSKTYGTLFWKQKKPALNNLNLQIPAGIIYGFLGPNGAGKTTTIKLIMDLIRPTTGKVLLFGKPPDDIEIKQMMGFLPDYPAFSSYLTAYEFLTICSKLLKIPPLERRDRIDEVMQTVNMTKHTNSKLGGFSRGMTQRIGIAQAILNKPKLLILDEPLTGLDPHGRQELMEIIAGQKKKGTNVFFSSHILYDVEKICDYVGILNEGELLCSGPIETLLSETGARVHVKHGEHEVAKMLMEDATGSIKLSDGSWDFVFPAKNDLKTKLEDISKKHPNSLTLTPAREKLEDFFFRKIDNARQIM